MTNPVRRCCPGETWRSVPGFEGLYSVSSCGQVKADAKTDSAGRQRREKPLRPALTGNSVKYPTTVLRRPGGEPVSYRVARLALSAFCGLDGGMALHGPLGPLNNHLPNLRWGTASENMLDRQRDGTDPNATKTHCTHGHPYDETNTYWYRNSRNGRQSRACKECRRIVVRESRKRQLS